jgi:carboxyl-terminal processing protease
MDLQNRKILIVTVAVTLVTGIFAGIGIANLQHSRSLPVVNRIINQDTKKIAEVDFSLFWEVWNSVNEKYVDKDQLDFQEMTYGAIHGMVNSLDDPYTVFFEPVESKKFKEEISGSFGGVGMEVGKRDGVLTVIAPLPDTPADRAGIKAGDKIVSVDSTPTAEMSIEEAVTLIRGPRGSKVILTLSRKGQDGTFDVEVIRSKIKIPTVKWELINDNIAYIRIHTFNQNVESDFKQSANEILGSKATSIIVDLRNNPGGLLDASINISGWFVDKGQIVTTEKFSDNTQNEFKSPGNASLKAYPTIVIINSGSASASEIMAGALRDNSGIQIIGEQSFGKGSVQELESYEGGSSLKVTIAKWLTPSGISISDQGIAPDIEVGLPDNPEEGELEFGVPTKDPQLDKAIEILQ